MRIIKGAMSPQLYKGIIMSKINNVEEFTSRLVAGLTGKALADVAMQDCAIFAINQSIEHSNADCGIRLVQQMQESKYGNIGAMVKYLCVNGNFEVIKNMLVFHRFEEAEKRESISEYKSTEWKEFAKVEKVQQEVNDAYILAQLAALLKRAKTFAKHHEGKGATPGILNKLEELAGPSKAVQTASTEPELQAAQVLGYKETRNNLNPLTKVSGFLWFFVNC